MLAIVNYGSGNVAALSAVLSDLRIQHVVTSDAKELAAADRFILPGVGAYDATLLRLERLGLRHELERQICTEEKKILGICVGMQLLGNTSEEGELTGLGWIAGRVRRIDTSRIERPPFLPHMGWNSVSLNRPTPLFDGVDLQQGFYFLHSYFFDAIDDETVVASTEYGGAIPCAVARGNVFGVQFHPEKSHDNGVRLLKNFVELA